MTEPSERQNTNDNGPDGGFRPMETIRGTFDAVRQLLDELEYRLDVTEYGVLERIDRGVAHVKGLSGARYEELIRFPGGRLGMVFNIDMDSAGIVMLDDSDNLNAGDEAQRTGNMPSVAVGEELAGRIVDPLCRPLDGRGAITADTTLPVERHAPAIMDRSPVTVPLQTGLKVVDALIPIGRGQRELIIGDRQTGKSAVAVDTIINQRNADVVCIYCAIGKRNSAVAKVISELEQHGAMDNTIVVIATGDDSPGLQFLAPYAATAMGEYFMENGRDALVVYDDLSRHAWAYRELSLLLRRPPAREAFPGDIFYIHSRLLERSTHYIDELGGGSLTALPIVETQAQNISAYIPTNLISITDGQIYLSPTLFQKGVLPAVDVGKSVSRVGGKTQLPAYRSVAGDLRLSYSQFEELESFARFGARLDEETKKNLEHGYRVREILKQPRQSPLSPSEQIAILVAASEGVFDNIPTGNIAGHERGIIQRLEEEASHIGEKITGGEKLGDDDIETLAGIARKIVDSGGED